MITEDMQLLYELRCELRKKRKAFNDSVKGLKASIQTLEQEITRQVLESGKTITVGRMKAEYKPIVVIGIQKKDEGANE